MAKLDELLLKDSLSLTEKEQLRNQIRYLESQVRSKPTSTSDTYTKAEVDRMLADIRRQIVPASTPQTMTYVPTWTAATLNPALVDGTLTGQYTIRNGWCLCTINLTIGASTTLGTGAWSFSLPVQASSVGLYSYGVAFIRNTGTASYHCLVQVDPSARTISTFSQLDAASNVNSLDATTPFAWGSTDIVRVTVEYRI